MSYIKFKEEIHKNEERLERLKIITDNKLDHFGDWKGVTNKFGKDSYILSKKVSIKYGRK